MDTESFIDNPLVIHHGTKANEALRLYLNDMRTTALKGKDGKTLDKTSVRTQRDASDAMSVIDGALDYTHSARRRPSAPTSRVSARRMRTS